ncbi:MAG: glycosyltransferase [Acidobacteria bacterium]|nr:glycosyltransferase [Acidobacteriota bacterium]
MRICHVSPHLPPDQAANAILPAHLGRWAAARGDDVRFLSLEPAQGSLAPAELPGRVCRLPLRRSRSAAVRALRLDTLTRTRTIARALDAHARDADLLHLHSNGLIVEVAAAWAHRRGLPVVLTLYGTEIWHYRPRWPIDPFTRAYRRAQEVTFYSQGLLDRARTLGLDRQGLSVIYPPVDDAFVPLDAAQRASLRQELGIAEPRLVLNVKRLHELAGQRFLIDAFAKVARGRTDIRLVICGTGPLRESLEHRAERAGVARQVTFAGLVPNHDVARYAAAADLFVLPSLLEALPTVAVEALAAGTPVLSADHPGGVELHGLFGDDVAVVAREDTDALAAALADRLTSPRRVRPSTLDLLQARFGRAAVDAAYLAVYRRVLAQRPASLRQ